MEEVGTTLKNLNDEYIKAKAFHQLAPGQALQIGDRGYDASRRHTK